MPPASDRNTKARPISKTEKRKLRLVVFPRDNWTCQDCGVRIPPKTDEQRAGRAAPTLRDLTLELDHIVPQSFGGGHSPDNLRAACNVCNNIKRASLSMAKWTLVIGEAKRILTEGQPGRATAERAIAVLSAPFTREDVA